MPGHVEHEGQRQARERARRADRDAQRPAIDPRRDRRSLPVRRRLGRDPVRGSDEGVRDDTSASVPTSANVNALVTPGLTRDAITQPVVTRVIGGATIALDNGNPDSENPGITPTPAHEELNLWIGDIVGAISQVGASKLTTYMG